MLQGQPACGQPLGNPAQRQGPLSHQCPLQAAQTRDRVGFVGRGGAEGTQPWAALPALKNQGQVSWPSVHRAHRCPHVPCQALLHCQCPLPLLNPLGHCPGGPVCLPPGATAANGPPGGWLTPGWEQWPGARGSGRTCGCPPSCSGFSVCPLHMAPAPEASLLSSTRLFICNF